MTSAMIASAVISDETPSRFRVEIIAPGVLEPWFPIEDLRVAVDGALIPRDYVEVSMKNAGGGMLTIVNKTRNPWREGALLEVILP